VARQFPGHGHSMPSRGLHEIEFFSDLIISEAEVSEIIARHGLSQRPPGDSRAGGMVRKQVKCFRPDQHVFLCPHEREKQDLTDRTRAFIEAHTDVRTSRCCHSGYAASEP
jgi:hypothetical protein